MRCQFKGFLVLVWQVKPIMSRGDEIIVRWMLEGLKDLKFVTNVPAKLILKLQARHQIHIIEKQ